MKNHVAYVKGDFGFDSGECDLQFPFSKSFWYAYIHRLNVWDQKGQPLVEAKSCDAADTALWDLDKRLKAKVIQCRQGNTFHT